MGINVQDKFAQNASVELITDDKGKLKFIEDGEVKGAVFLGATNALGPKTVENDKGVFITELRDVVGGLLNGDDVAKLFGRMTFSDGRGDVEGIDNVKLIGLTDDAFTLAFDNGRAVDTLTIEVGQDFINGFDTGADLGDGKSRFSVLDVDDGDTAIGTSGGFGDLVGGSLSGEDDAAAVLEAAIKGDARLELVGLEADNFTLRFMSGGKTDTILFTDAAGAIAKADGAFKGFVNPGNNVGQAVIVEEGQSGNIGIGTSGRYEDSNGNGVGGQLSVEDAYLLARTANDRAGVEAIDQGDTVRLELAGNAGSTDIIVLPDTEEGLVVAGSYDSFIG